MRVPFPLRHIHCAPVRRAFTRFLTRLSVTPNKTLDRRVPGPVGRLNRGHVAQSMPCSDSPGNLALASYRASLHTGFWCLDATSWATSEGAPVRVAPFSSGVSDTSERIAIPPTYCGHIDLRAQAEMLSALRSYTPTLVVGREDGRCPCRQGCVLDRARLPLGQARESAVLEGPEESGFLPVSRSSGKGQARPDRNFNGRMELWHCVPGEMP